MTTPTGGGSSHAFGFSGAKIGKNHTNVAVEMGMIWKPLIMDIQGHHILETHNSLMNPNIAVSIVKSCILLVGVVESKKLFEE